MVTRLIAGAVLAWMAAGWAGAAPLAEDPAGAQARAAEAKAPAAAHGKAEGHASEGESEAEALNPITLRGFNFTGDLTVWTAVIFLVVLLILWKAAWGPITQGLQKREQQIAAQIAEAQRSNQEAQRLLAEYDKKLAASQGEVRAIFDQARRDAEQVGRTMIEKAKEDAAAEGQRAIKQINAAAAAASKELAERSASLAVDLAGKILRAQLKPQDHARLIREAVSQFQGQGTGTN